MESMSSSAAESSGSEYDVEKDGGMNRLSSSTNSDVGPQTWYNNMSVSYLILSLYLSWTFGKFPAPVTASFSEASTICGDGHCMCSRYRANCSGKGLTYIPWISPDITNLDLSNNTFMSLSDAFFANISTKNIITLNISFCQIEHLAPNTLTNFTGLELLVMNHNPVDSSEFTTAITAPKFLHLSTLHIAKLNISDIYIFKNITSPHLKYLYIDHNALNVYDQSMFSHNDQLSKVSAKGNIISKLMFSYSKELVDLFLDINLISTIPSFCSEGGSPHFPKLTRLYLPYNSLYDIANTFECLPNLKSLKLNGIPIRKLVSNTFSKLPKLEGLYLRSLPSKPDIAAYAFNNSGVYYLTLTNSHIDFDSVDDNAFKGLKSLNFLDVTANKFGVVTENKMIKLFGHLSNLRNIAMGSCQLENIPVFIFNFNQLMGVSLYQNRIKNLPDNIFAKHVHLQKLWLDQNEITTIRESTISPDIRKGLKVLNLANNPFNCDCSLRWFIDWTKEQSDVFQEYPNKYVCSNPSDKNRHRLNDIHFGLNECFLSLTVLSSVVGTSAVFMLVVTLASLLYKLRWRIRHYIYMNYHRPRQHVAQREAIEYTYDAYIIHSDEDEDWVVEEMLPCLEDQHHMKLCVPGRDFLPGGYILNNIDQAIQTSRRIVVVLSSSFVESEWCQAELSMAQSFVLDTRGNALLAVLLEEPDARNMRHSLHVLLKSTAYIVWGEEEEAKQLFWRRLVESLNHDALDLRIEQ